MNKNVVITILSVLCLLLAAFGFMQRSEAQKQKEISTQMHVVAQENEKRAIQLQKIAEEQRMLAQANAQAAQQALEDCEQSKR